MITPKYVCDKCGTVAPMPEIRDDVGIYPPGGWMRSILYTQAEEGQSQTAQTTQFFCPTCSVALKAAAAPPGG